MGFVVTLSVLFGESIMFQHPYFYIQIDKFNVLKYLPTYSKSLFDVVFRISTVHTRRTLILVHPSFDDRINVLFRDHDSVPTKMFCKALAPICPNKSVLFYRWCCHYCQSLGEQLINKQLSLDCPGKAEG